MTYFSHNVLKLHKRKDNFGISCPSFCVAFDDELSIVYNLNLSTISFKELA